MKALHGFIVIYQIGMALLKSRRLLGLPNLEGPLSDIMPSSTIVAADSEGFN